MSPPPTGICTAAPLQRLHHAAYRCADSEQTRRFYEDFLGLPLVCTLEIRETKTGRSTDTLHTFYALGDGSCLAFFEAPDMGFDFKPQHDYDLHIAIEVDSATLDAMLARGAAAGIETRGIVDQVLFRSAYFRDPNGYVIELACPQAVQAAGMDPSLNGARATLDRWTMERRGAVPPCPPDSH